MNNFAKTAKYNDIIKFKSNFIWIIDNRSAGAEANSVFIDLESYVSINFWGFPAKKGCAPAYQGILEQGFKESFENDVKVNLGDVVTKSMISVTVRQK